MLKSCPSFVHTQFEIHICNFQGRGRLYRGGCFNNRKRNPNHTHFDSHFPWLCVVDTYREELQEVYYRLEKNSRKHHLRLFLPLFCWNLRQPKWKKGGLSSRVLVIAETSVCRRISATMQIYFKSPSPLPPSVCLNFQTMLPCWLSLVQKDRSPGLKLRRFPAGACSLCSAFIIGSKYCYQLPLHVLTKFDFFLVYGKTLAFCKLKKRPRVMCQLRCGTKVDIF